MPTLRDLDSLRLCAVSVDLDEIHNYHAIHGLEPPQGAGATAVYDIAVPRLATLAAEHSIPLTLFAVGADLDRPGSADALRRMREDGHEIANHTLDHAYDVTHRAPNEVRRQLEEGAAAIERAVGRRPAGFRAPGYVIHDGLLDALQETGHAYDTSVFPCPSYFAAKAAAMTWIALRGRTSRSVQDHPRVLLAPTRPYRPGSPYHRRGNRPLIELPVQVTRGLRLPFIGTSLTLGGERTARALTRMVVGEPVVNLELHGMDVLDAGDGLDALRGHQPDVRVEQAHKVRILGSVFELLRSEGYRFVTLEDAARQVAERIDAQR